MNIKDQLRPLLLPYVIAERDAVNAVNKEYRDWWHVYYSLKPHYDEDKTQTRTYTLEQLENLYGGFFLQAGIAKDQTITMEVLVHQIMRILYEADLVDEMPIIDTCMVAEDGTVRVGGSCTGGGGGGGGW